MRSVFVVLFCMAFAVCHTLVAQQIDSLRPVLLSDSTQRVFSLNYSIGIVPVTAASLNEFLSHYGYGANRFSDGVFDHPAFDLGVSLTTDRWRIEPKISALLPISSNQSGTEITHTFWTMQSNIGYQIVHTGDRQEFSLFPFAGLGARFNRLAIVENPKTSFEATFNDSTSRNYSFSNESLYGEIGIGADYAIAISENERSMTSLVIGLRAGYQFGLLSEDWRQSNNNQRLTDGPDMKPNGVTAWLTIGWQSQPKIYDAHIIAERKPTQTGDEEVH